MESNKLPPPPHCNLDSYPSSGGSGTGENSCDDWPPVPQVTISKKDCVCPPDVAGYNWRRSAVFLNVIPFVGQAVNMGIGMPEDCLSILSASSNAFADQTSELVAKIEEFEDSWRTVAVTLSEIYSPSKNGKATGILPTAIEMALQPALSTTLYLGIISVSIFLVLLGVVFTI